MQNFYLATFIDWLVENKEAYTKGPGLYCTAHIILMVVLASWLIGYIFIAFKHPKFAKKFGAVLCISMSVLRVIRMIIQVASGKYTFVEALPWHLCHIMCFSLTAVYFVKSTKFSLPILCLSVLGGIMTFIFGDYYYVNGVTFYMLESIFLHFCLPTVVISYIAVKRPKYTWKSILEVPIVLLILAGWASIGNKIFPEQNFMYLKHNGLPFNLFGDAHFLWTYLVIGIILIAIVAAVYFIYKAIKKRKNMPAPQPANQDNNDQQA